MDSIGKRLKQLRTLSGLTQEKVASDLNISQSTLASYETDYRTPKVDIMGSLADYYNVPIEFLLGTGPYKYWDELLKNKEHVLSIMSDAFARISYGLDTVGTDDLTYARLVGLFRIKGDHNKDGDFTYSIEDPFPSYTAQPTHPAPKGPWDDKLLSVFQSLGEDDQIKVYAKALELRDAPPTDGPVAAGSDQEVEEVLRQAK